MIIEPKPLHHWIDTFYGYGALSARFWFVSHEDGGGDLPEEVAEKLNYFYRLGCTDATLCDIRDLYRHASIHWDGPKADLFTNLYEYRFGSQAQLSGVWKNLIAFLQHRNRSIRAAAFEGMAPGHEVSDALISYHTALAQGGVGMTTVAYASVNKGGLSFPHQLYMRKEIKASLQKLTAAVHKERTAVSIQLGHGGNMANRTVTGIRPVAGSGGINWYGPTFPRSMLTHDIESLKKDFIQAVLLASQTGFDAVEIHAGHGYLISQSLSPYTNKRKALYGGKFENRKRLMTEVLRSVREAMREKMALLVKMNWWDGFEGGITREDGILTAKEIAACGADAVIVSGGFVSRAPMYVMRGKMPVDIMAYFMTRIPGSAPLSGASR